MQYLVTVPNPKYNEKTFGIRFNDGKAVLSDVTLDPKIGLTLEELAQKFAADFGYTVTPIEEAKPEPKKK